MSSVFRFANCEAVRLVQAAAGGLHSAMLPSASAVIVVVQIVKLCNLCRLLPEGFTDIQYNSS